MSGGAKIHQKCEAMTKAGNPCKASAYYGSNPPRCVQHMTKTVEDNAAARARAKALFLDAYRATFDVTKSAQVTGYSPTTLRMWRYEDPEFEKDWEEAKTTCLEDLEHSLFQRGMGVEVVEVTRERAVTIIDGERVYYGGNDDELLVTKTTTKWVADTKAAEIILRGHNPQRHRHDRQSLTVNIPRRPEDESTMEDLMNDPKTRAALDDLLDSDMST
jgi:hypothetical protein